MIVVVVVVQMHVGTSFPRMRDWVCCNDRRYFPPVLDDIGVDYVREKRMQTTEKMSTLLLPGRGRHEIDHGLESHRGKIFGGPCRG